MASSPFTSWQMEREKAEVVSDFIFLGSKITSDGDYSHEIKRHLLFGRKAMTNLDSVVKSRDITLLTKAHIIKLWFFPVVMYGCESWTIQKVECQEHMLSNCAAGEDSWESLELQGDQTSQSKRKSNLWSRKSKEELMLKLQYFGHLMRRADSLERNPMLGKIESKRKWGWQRIRWLDSILTQCMWIWEHSRK